MENMSNIILVVLGIVILWFLWRFFSAQLSVKSVQVSDLQKYIDEKAVFIDVRERSETPKYKFPNIKQIPMSEFKKRLNEIPKQGDVLVFCHSGMRSANVVRFLSKNGYDNVLNIKGGSMALSRTFPKFVK